MLRKRSYKGSQSSGSASLPVDGATSLGILQVLASVLPANGLQAAAIGQCYEILAFVSHFMSVNVTLFPLGRNFECELEITNNEMNTKQLQFVLKRAGLQWFRPGFRFPYFPDSANFKFLFSSQFVLNLINHISDSLVHSTTSVLALRHLLVLQVSKEIAKTLWRHCEPGKLPDLSLSCAS